VDRHGIDPEPLAAFLRRAGIGQDAFKIADHHVTAEQGIDPREESAAAVCGKGRAKGDGAEVDVAGEGQPDG
jgi:hypothetical protein